MRDAAYAHQARMDAAKKQKNPNLYEDSTGNIKAKNRKSRKPKVKKNASSFSPPARASGRPEDKYGVRNRRSGGKSLGVSASRSQDRLRAGVRF